MGATTGEKGSWGPLQVKGVIGAAAGEKWSSGPLQERRGHGGRYR